MTSTKWFRGVTNRKELKALYKELVKKYHPDCGGNEADMKAINAEYDQLFKVLPDVTKDGTEYKKADYQTGRTGSTKERPEDFRNALAAVIRFNDIEIEICGDWIWLHGNTFAHKDVIKNAGYYYSSNKKSWYWHDADYVKKNHKHYSMNEIRLMHGSEFVQTESQQQITA